MKSFKNDLILNIENYTSLLKNLKIIGAIQPNDKISTKCNKIIIDNSRLSYIWRFLYGENRELNVQYIQKIILQSFVVLNNFIKYYKQNSSKESDKQCLLNNMKIFAEAINDAKNGMKNLKNTYETDSTIKSHIDVLLKIIECKLLKYKVTNK
jgi:hypothetical protein